MTKFEKLFSKFHLGNLTLSNRTVVAPMTRISATEDGLATERMARYYANFANGGFGLLISEGTYLDETYSQSYLNQPGIANEAQVESWKKVTHAVHQQGSNIFCQLMYSGALSQGNSYTNETIAPSSVKPKTEPALAGTGRTEFFLPREMTYDDIQAVINSFADSAVRAREAGFDGVEIHGANGYLLDQFLTDYTNQRTDKYGGSIENRVRLMVEVIQAVRKAVGSMFVVGIRVSQTKVNDYHHKWASGEKEAEVIFKSLGKAGVDFIHINEYDATKPAFDDKGSSLAAFAKKYAGVAVIACGHLEDPSKGETLLSRGEADLIALGKGALANPDWIKKMVEGSSLSTLEDFTYPIKDKELL
ncbi:MAG: NADH:flavin oxidoreductase [Paenibacillaceae bacterium]|nr:NADH:flavin oxidoreductase [Paenibacillaceae bacterium]